MLLVGMVDPNSLQITVGQGLNTGVNLSTMVGAELSVRKPSATTDVTWVPNTVTSTATSTVLVYKFQAGDLNEPGCYILRPKIYDADGTKERFCSEVSMQVYEA